MKKKSSLDYGISESRRRCDCGISFIGEWAFEGEPKALQVGFDGRQPLSAQCIFSARAFARHILVHEEA